jgi:hypothetical protein
MVITPHGLTRSGAVGSMGNDAALRCVQRPLLLFALFKQLFAQVTHPPIDPLRVELVIVVVSFVGPRSLALEDRRRTTLV